MRNTPRHVVSTLFMGFSVLLLVSASLYAYASYHNTTIGKALHVPVAASSPTQPPISCKTPNHPAGDTTATVTSDGLKRGYLIYLAPSYERQSQALVLVYHGYSWTSQIIMEHIQSGTHPVKREGLAPHSHFA